MKYHSHNSRRSFNTQYATTATNIFKMPLHLLQKTKRVVDLYIAMD